MRKVAGELLGGRVCKCGVEPVPGSGNVALVKAQDSSYYSGLQRCSSVWHCPYCSYKISSYRAQQIAQITEKVIGSGGSAGMATFTISHHAYQSLEAVADGIRTIWDKMTKRRDFKALMKVWDRIGYVRALEVTHGENGWHPHLHVLFWSWETEEDHAQVVTAMFDIWQDVAKKNGYMALAGGFAYSAVDNVAGVAEYVSKWGVAKEVAQGNIRKNGKSGGRTPFQILAQIEATTEPDRKDIALFKEYAETFKGRRQLTWSRGVKKEWLSLDDLTDEQICQMEEDGEPVAIMSRKVWRQIVAQDLPPLLINAYESEGQQGVFNVLKRRGIDYSRYGPYIKASGEPPPFNHQSSSP